MERHSEKPSRLGPKVIINVDPSRLRGARKRPVDPDEEEYIAEEAFWEAILGVKPIRWDWDTDKVSDSQRPLLDEALKNIEKYSMDLNDYYDRIDELNDTLSEGKQFSYVVIKPRFPSPRCFHFWHRDFRMTNTNPTSVRSKRFTEPCAYEYVSSDLLQLFSINFAGDFSQSETMSIYGFMAVRDNIDHLRNYIFNRSREHAQEITSDARELSLIPPTRGISAPFNIIVEYCLKVKSNSADNSEEDGVLIDGCFDFMQSRIAPHVQRYKVRLFGPLGPLDIRFALLRFAVEATIDVKVKRATAGYSLSVVTASTCGFEDDVMLYDASALSPATADHGKKDTGNLSPSSMVAVESAVVAVELGCHLKLRFEISREESERGLGRDVRKSSHELLFTSRKHKSTKGVIVIGRKFKLAVKVTWSTMGDRFLPFLHSDLNLLGRQEGPCSF